MEGSGMKTAFDLSPKRRPLPFTACCLLTMLAGCGGDVFDMVKASGKVTYEDGSLIPASKLDLVFHAQVAPIDASTHPRPGWADVRIEDGTFDAVTSHRYGDGIVVGEHKVAVLCQPPELVPAQYVTPDTTPLVVHSKDSPFTFLVRKPGATRSGR